MASSLSNHTLGPLFRLRSALSPALAMRHLTKQVSESLRSEGGATRASLCPAYPGTLLSPAGADLGDP